MSGTLSYTNDYARCWHYLSPNKRSATPTNFAFVACDTYSQADDRKIGHKIHKLSQWSAIGIRLEKNKWSRRIQDTGESITGFWNWLYGRLDKRRPLWLWGYGISQQMQLLAFGTEIEIGHLEWQTVDYNLCIGSNGGETVTWQGALVLEDPPTVIELRHTQSGAKLWILDTLNFWRCDHEEFTAAFSKLDDPDTSERPIKIPSVQPCILASICTETAITTLVSTIRNRDLGNMRWTVAAQGLQAYRHRFMKHKILVHCDELGLKLERESYFGGNVSLYRYGIVEGPIYVVDYQSYYPAVMASRDVPIRWLGSTTDRVRCSDISRCADCWRIARVTLNTGSSTYPVRYRGRLVLASGNFCTTLSEPELRRAISEGVITGIQAISWYSRANCFAKFVLELWGYRCEAIRAGKDVEARFYKLLLNGVPGKFGQRQIQWIDEPEKYATRAWGNESVLNCDTGKIEHLRYLNWRVQRRRLIGEHVLGVGEVAPDCDSSPVGAYPTGPTINDESRHSVPQIAGAITSWGREILLETINVAKAENVYYTDTDCLHVNRCGFSNLEKAGKIRPDTLGALSVKTIASQAEYRGIKYYRLDDVWTVSGRKKSASGIVDGKWEQSEYTGWSSLLYDGTCGYISEYTVPCDRSNECIPGVVLPDGRVTPIRLNAPTETEISATLAN